MKRSLIIEIIAALLILLFAYAAITKLLSYAEFKEQLIYSPIGKRFAGLLAWLVPAAELIIAISLLIPAYRKTGFCLSFLLMLSFTLYVYYVLNFVYEVPCACGGVLSRMGWKEHLVFNIIYTLIALAGILLSQKYSSAQKNRTSRKPVTE
jgi:uncharacterized membrane protein YphA (DoxX/SURF4 family)